jgi:hypothetical protein
VAGLHETGEILHKTGKIIDRAAQRGQQPIRDD